MSNHESYDLGTVALVATVGKLKDIILKANKLGLWGKEIVRVEIRENEHFIVEIYTEERSGIDGPQSSDD